MKMLLAFSSRLKIAPLTFALSFIVFSFSLCFVSGAESQVPSQTFVDLSTLTGIRLTSMQAVSSNGRYVAATISTNEACIFDLETGALNRIQGSYVSVHAINNYAQAIVRTGYSDTLHSFLWNNGTLSSIEAPDQFLYDLNNGEPLYTRQTVANGINDYGTIVGFIVDQDHIEDGFIYENGQFHGVRGELYVNQAPTIVTEDGTIYGSSWENGSQIRVDAFEAQRTFQGPWIIGSSRFSGDLYSTTTVASDIGHHTAGNITYTPWSGFSPPSPDAYIAGYFGYSLIPRLNGGYVIPTGINNSGVAVGIEYNPGNFAVRSNWAFDGRQIINLSAYTPVGSNWIISQITDIGNNGVMFGNGKHNNIATAFMLKPQVSIDFTDPNPFGDSNYYSTLKWPKTYNSKPAPNSTLDWNAERIVGTRSVYGVAADGVTRVVIRVPVPTNGSVDLKIRDENNGTTGIGAIGTLGAEPTQTTLLGLHPTLVNGQWYVFATYLAPLDFDRTAADGSLTGRFVQVSTHFTSSVGGDPIDAVRSLNIVRPPVVFLHGLWSDAASWQYSFIKNDPRFQVYVEDYESTHDKHFIRNVPHARHAAIHALVQMRDKGYAATQVSVIGHSMGGILARLHAANSQYDYYRADNLGQGDFYKLITLYTPHQGSGFACVLDDWKDWIPDRFAKPKCLNCGAVQDLRPDSDIIQHLPAAPIPSHVIAGRGGAMAINGLGGSRHYSADLAYMVAVFAATQAKQTLANQFAKAIGEPTHDLVVGLSSALTSMPQAATHQVAYQQPISGEWPVGVHLDAGKQEYLANQILIPLLLASVNSSQFAQSLPQNSNVFVPDSCGAAPIPPPQEATNGGIVIGIVPGYETVAPGQLTRIEVITSGDFQPLSRSIVSELTGFTTYQAFPYIFAVPVDAYGDYEFQAVGVDAAGKVAISQPVVLHVRSAATLKGIEINSSLITLGCAGESQQLHVAGDFSDSTQHDITNAEAGTVYVSGDPSIASVTDAGVVVAHQTGATTITVSNGEYSDSAMVYVSAAWCPRRIVSGHISSPVPTPTGQSVHVCPIGQSC